MGTQAPAIAATSTPCSLCGEPFTATERRRLFCSKRCSGRAAAAKHERPLADRFWEKVDQSGGPEACWPWLRSRNKKGYGKVKRAGRGGSISAHRTAWELTNGPIPEGQHALHECDNPPCCNPSHIYPGTNKANVEDKVAKGRQAKGAKTAILGERHGNAKLTVDAVREMRRMVAAGASQKEAAARFGVRDNTVSKIVARKAWSHVQ